jgi:fluoroacetyl-CoA thioesterase
MNTPRKKKARKRSLPRSTRPREALPRQKAHDVRPTVPATPGGPRLGLEAIVEMTVPHQWTIQHYDANLPAVLSTPAMIGMMELAAAQAVQGELSSGAITVGTRIEVDHLKAVTTGAAVRAQARLVGHEGRFLVFEVEARSGNTLIGRGRVFRAIVEPAGFATVAAEEGSRVGVPGSPR